jgi:hypothetical protein
MPVPLSGEDVPSDPGAELRKKEPMDKARTVRAFSRWRALRAAASMASRPHILGAIRFLAHFFQLGSLIPIVFAAFRFNTDEFGEKQLQAGAAAIILGCGHMFVTFLLASLSERKDADDAEAHPWTGLVRWVELVDTEEDKGRTKEDSSDQDIELGSTSSSSGKDKDDRACRLVQHEKIASRSAYCPCPLKSCAGKLPMQTVWTMLARHIAISASFATLFLGYIYTSAITFRADFWETWWCEVACGIYIYCDSVAQFTSPSLLDLSMRLHYRAVAISLSNLLDRARFSLDHGGFPEEGELHVTLHRILASVWKKRMSDGQGVNQKQYLWWTFMVLIGILIIVTATGDCVPFYVLIQAVGIVLFCFLEFVSLASANSEVDAISLLYTEGRDELRLLLARMPEQGSPELRDYLRLQVDILSSFADNERYKSQVFGFAISFNILVS